MTVHTLHDNLLPIDKHTIFLIASIRVAIFNSAEAKLLALHMEGTTLSVFQRKDSGIKVGLLSIPQFGILCTELCLGLVASNDIGRARGNLLSIGIDNINAYLTAWHCPI